MPPPVPHSLGADLVWWRTSGGLRTVVCLFWGGDLAFTQPVHLTACLHNPQGREQVRWRIPLPPDAPVVLDSAAAGEWSAFAGSDAVLVLHLCTDDVPLPEAFQHERLYPIVDWRTPEGRLSTLHSDQIVSRRVTQPQGFTEIVVVETETEHNALVILTGDQPQAPGALELTVANHRGERLSARHPGAMPPFCVNEIRLASLFPDVVAFAEGRPLLVEGAFDSRGLFTRPYVVTTGSRQGVYHGGDRYHWAPLHPVRHAMIQGEVNPMAVMQDEHTRTWINVLHSHGGHEADVPVDLRLFDDQGRCVLEQTPACIAGRGRLARIDLATLLPPDTAFSGHVALSYSASKDQPVPQHVQALLEYQHRESVAHIMGWSDEWNSRPMLAKRKKRPPHLNRSWYRVWHDDGLQTVVAITNAGHPGYEETASARLVLHGADGSVQETTVDIAPYATLRASMAELFGPVLTMPGPGGIGILRMDSTSDLAAISITSNPQGTAWAMEHFMSLTTLADDAMRMPAGS
jgi:hypothetical protein